jgi:hypothetical protein
MPTIQIPGHSPILFHHPRELRSKRPPLPAQPIHEWPTLLSQFSELCNEVTQGVRCELQHVRAPLEFLVTNHVRARLEDVPEAKREHFVTTLRPLLGRVHPFEGVLSGAEWFGSPPGGGGQ